VDGDKPAAPLMAVVSLAPYVQQGGRKPRWEARHLGRRGGSIVEHVAGVDDFEVAEATYRAAARWPAARITATFV
jgi:hypothetical protein